METWSHLRFGALRGSGGIHGCHFGLQLCKLGLPTLVFNGGSLSFFVLLIAACFSSFTPRRLQFGMDLPTLGLVVSLDTAPRAESSALSRGSLAFLAFFPQVSYFATFEISGVSLCSMRRQASLFQSALEFQIQTATRVALPFAMLHYAPESLTPCLVYCTNVGPLATQ